MPKTTTHANEPESSTGDYSATKAPENREHVRSEEPTGDKSLKPGGPRGVAVEVGMAGLYRETVPSQAEDTAPGDDDSHPAK